MDWHYRACLRLRMIQNEVAAPLPVLDESRALEGSNRLPRGQSRKLCHGSSGSRNRDRHSALERFPFFRNQFPVGDETFQIQRNRFFDVALRFFQRLSLGMAARQSGNQRYKATFRGLLVVDRVRKDLGTPSLHYLHCSCCNRVSKSLACFSAGALCRSHPHAAVRGPRRGIG